MSWSSRPPAEIWRTAIVELLRTHGVWNRVDTRIGRASELTRVAADQCTQSRVVVRAGRRLDGRREDAPLPLLVGVRRNMLVQSDGCAA